MFCILIECYLVAYFWQNDSSEICRLFEAISESAFSCSCTISAYPPSLRLYQIKNSLHETPCFAVFILVLTENDKSDWFKIKKYVLETDYK